MKESFFLNIRNPKSNEIQRTILVENFDPNIPFLFITNRESSLPTRRSFKSIDDLILDTDTIISLGFSIRYIRFINENNYETKLSLQDLFELSLLKDDDIKPKDEAFDYAFLSNDTKNEMLQFKNFFAITLWLILEPLDFEFLRRLLDIKLNLNEYLRLDNPFVSTSANVNDPFLSSIKSSSDLNLMNEKLHSLEGKLTKDLNLPDNVLFDGKNFVVLMKNSPVFLKLGIEWGYNHYNFGGTTVGTKRANKKKLYEEDKYKTLKLNYDIGKSRRKKTVGGTYQESETLNISEIKGGFFSNHPCTSSPLYLNREKTMRYGSSAKIAWDNCYDKIIANAINEIKKPSINNSEIIKELEQIKVISMLKNDGSPYSETPCGNCENCENNIKCEKIIYASELLNEYMHQRGLILKEYSESRRIMDKHLESFFMNLLDKKKTISLYFKSSNSNGYFTVNFKLNNKTNTRKLDSSALFYDKDFKLIEKTENFFDYEMSRVEYDTLKKDGCSSYEIYEQMIYNIVGKVSSSTIIGYDYNRGMNSDIRFIFNQRNSLNKFIYPKNKFSNKFDDLFHANSIERYVISLKKTIKKEGHLNYKNIEEAVDLLENGSLLPCRTNHEEYVIEDKFNLNIGLMGGYPKHERNIVELIHKDSDEFINSFDFTPIKTHVKFNDVDYA